MKKSATIPSSPAQPLASWYAQGLSDDLGDRLLMFDNSGAPSLELLRFRPDLAHVPGFEAALREQVQRLAHFRHPAFVAARAVQRLEPDDDLALISNYTPGKRLTEILHRARGPEFAAALIRQVAPALVALQKHDPGLSHGLLTSDRIILSPEGRLTIVEHVVGPAIDTLNVGTTHLESFGIALPPGTNGTARLDVSTDWYQLGLVAVAVLIGRPLRSGERQHVAALLEGSELPAFMRQWFDRALQISGARIESGDEALAAFEDLVHQRSRRGPRLVSARREQPVPHHPSLVTDVDPFADLPSEAEEAPVLAESPSLPPVRGPAAAEDEWVFSMLDARQPRQAPAPHVRSLFEQYPQPEKKRPVKPPEHVAPAKPERAIEVAPITTARQRFAVYAFVAVVLIAAVEAGLIAWLARGWNAPEQPFAVQTAASGENMLVSNRPVEPGQLKLTFGPDLRWLRVASTAPVATAKVAPTTTGTVRISSPIELKVFQQTRLLGTVPGADLKLPAGRHEIELANAALAYRLRQTVDVAAGQSVAIHVAPPPGSVTIDASPWAEVWIDGQPAGRTPLGPMPLALGEHEIVFRNPVGTKDRQRVTVKSDTSTRVVGVLR